MKILYLLMVNLKKIPKYLFIGVARHLFEKCGRHVNFNFFDHFDFKNIQISDYVEESTEAEECELAIDDIQFMIDNLPDGYRMVFNLYAIEGFKHKEIAVLLGINEGTSKSQLSHSRKILQQQINATKSYDYGTK